MCLDSAETTHTDNLSFRWRSDVVVLLFKHICHTGGPPARPSGGAAASSIFLPGPCAGRVEGKRPTGDPSPAENHHGAGEQLI